MTSQGRPLVLGLLVVQAAVSAALWVLNATSINSTAGFALLLAADLIIFAFVCHLSFFSEEEEAERAMPVAMAVSYVQDDAQEHHEEPIRTQPLLELPTVLSRNIRIGVPVFSVAMLLLLSTMVASGRGTTDVFIPIFVLMVCVYVLSSIYFFKALLERDKATAAVSPAGDGHSESHH